jgi:twitching motility protein PilI
MDSIQHLQPSQQNSPAAVTAAAHWLAVEAAGASLLIPLSHSGEISPWVKPHFVPYTKDWFLGVVNLRGSLCGVADLSKWLSLQPASQPSTAASAGEKCFVGFHASLELNTVLVVDQLLGLKSLESMTQHVGSDAAAQLIDSDGRVWREIDMFGLAKDANFVNIAAIH